MRVYSVRFQVVKERRHRLAMTRESFDSQSFPTHCRGGVKVVEPGRIELPTSCVQGRRSPS